MMIDKETMSRRIFKNPKLGMTDHYKITKQPKTIFYDGTLITIRPRGLGRYITVPTTTTTTTTFIQ